jgi:PAS domain-containing protein
VARDIVVEEMKDGMIVLDTQSRIVDINTSGQRTIGKSAAQLIGENVSDALQAWPQLTNRYANVVDAQDEISIGEGENRCQRRLSGVRTNPAADLVLSRGKTTAGPATRAGAERTVAAARAFGEPGTITQSPGVRLGWRSPSRSKDLLSRRFNGWRILHGRFDGVRCRYSDRLIYEEREYGPIHRRLPLRQRPN